MSGDNKLPDIDHIPNYLRKRKGDFQATYECPCCPFETSDVYKLELHSNHHLDEQEYAKPREQSMEEDDKLEDELREDDVPPAKRKRTGGIKSNVPFLEEDVIYQGFPVNFKRVLLKGLVDTAQKNLDELKTGKVKYRWNRSFLTAWLSENVPDSKKYTKETLKKRFNIVIDESNKFVMTKKESSATGIRKMKKNIDPKLHSEEEKEMAQMGSMFAHLRKEIDETPIKQNSKKVAPRVEAKAKKLNEMLEGHQENDEDLDGKKKISRGTLKGLPYDMFEKSQQHRLKSVQDHYESQKETKEPTKHAQKDDFESTVMNLCKTTMERMNISQAPNPQQVLSPCMPYGYAYPGLMGAPQPMGMPFTPMIQPTQHMGMAPRNMFRPPMSFQPPSTPVHNKSANSAAEGFSIGSTLPEAGIFGRGRSSSEHARASLTGEGGPSSERDSEKVRNSVIKEKEISSAGFAPQKQRTSVIGKTGQVFDQAKDAKPAPAEGRKSVISSSMQSFGRAPVDIISTAPQSTAGPAPMAYAVQNMHSHVNQQSQAGKMVYSDVITAQAGASPIVQKQMASLMAYQHGYPQTFQRFTSPMMMPGYSNSSVPNGMGSGPGKKKENKKSDEFNDDEDY